VELICAKKDNLILSDELPTILQLHSSIALHVGLNLHCIVGKAGQGCQARLPGKATRQGCQARLPGKAARQGCQARLPGKAARKGCQARLPGKSVGKGCMQ
jgi:hypothetical protein